jgi:thiol-disulfide isomerase/thioredoxin
LKITTHRTELDSKHKSFVIHYPSIMLTAKYFIAILGIFATFLSACSGEIVALKDDTFEHQTQASTGMTTGSWLLFFKAQKCPHCRKLLPEYERLSVDEELMERGVVLGTVDIMESPKTANRFMIRGFPTLIYLHQKKLYRYTGKRDFESIKEFIISSGIDAAEGEEIPTPPSQLEAWVKTLKAIGLELYDAALGKSGPAGYAILLLVSMLVSMLGFIVSMFFMPAKKTKNA